LKGVINWRNLLGPPSLVMSTALVVAAVVPAALAAGPLRPPPTPKPPCPVPGMLVQGELSAVRERSPGARLTQETLLTERGEEKGRRLAVGSGALDATAITLPPESFVAGPFGALVIYGSHTPAAGSEVRAVAMSTGCDERLARPAGIVRGAVLDTSGRALYVHAVTDGERRDAGVVRHDLATGRQTQVVEPLPDSDVYGPTFATSLLWSADGRELAVQSCGFSRCRTRVLDTASGALRTFDENFHGALIGFDRQALYAFDACHWAPCDVVTIDRSTGATSVVAEDAYDASFSAGEGRSRLMVEATNGWAEVAP
jgi:hypothetical protein